MTHPRAGRWDVGELAVLTTMGLGQFAISVTRVAAQYKAIELGASAFGIGLVGGAFGALALVVAIPIGVVVDRRGGRTILMGALAAILVAPILEGYATELALVIGGQMILGLGQTAFAIAAQNRIAHSQNALSGDERFARLSVSASTAQLAGPIVAGSLIGVAFVSGIEMSGLLTAFWLAAVAGAAGLTVMVLRGGSGHEPSGASSRLERTSLRELLRQPGMPTSLGTSLILLSSLDLLITYLPLVGEERGFAPAFIGALLSIRAGATLASRVALGAMVRAVGRNLILVVALAAAGIGMLVVALPSPAPVLVLSLGVIGLGLGVGQPLTIAWTVESAPGSTGSALALRMTGNRAGQMAVPALLGGLAATLGSGIIFIAAGVALSVCSMGLRRLRRRGP